MARREHITQFPHCDPRVLHAPEDNCEFCNKHPLWQELRKAWGIAFTGHSFDKDGKLFELDHGWIQQPCPAEANRGMKSIDGWHGNICMTPERIKASDEYYDKLRKEFHEMYPDEDYIDDDLEIGGES
jgi:hypothetical protein